MHLKCHRRLKGGKEHRYWSIADSRRCPAGALAEGNRYGVKSFAVWIRAGIGVNPYFGSLLS